MPIVRAQVVIERDTSLPADVSVNVWHFLTSPGALTDTIATQIHTALTSFYNAVDDLLSPVLKEAATVKYYDLSLAQPNPPSFVKPMTLVLGSGATPFPEEVALCLSFKGLPGPGLNAARRRGRVYLGPLAGGGQVVTGGRVLVGSAQVAQVATAAGSLLNASGLATTWDWGIYSPTQAAAGGTPDDWFTPVAAGWVDNVYDTQRRRGPTATARTVFP